MNVTPNNENETKQNERKTKICNKCNKRKRTEQYNKDHQSPDSLSYSCKKCLSIYSKAHNKKNNFKVLKTCKCGRTYEVRKNTLKNSIRENRGCLICSKKKWRDEKFGIKKDRTFTVKCPRCGKLKTHKWKNQSDKQLERVIRDLSKKNCKSCSNTLNYTVPKIHKNTKPEKEFKQYLKILKIKYKQSYKIPNYGKIFDFYLDEFKTLVEIDGTYWHSKGLEENQLNEAQLKNRINDKVKDEICKKENIKLVRIWSDEINLPNIIKKLEIE